MFFVLDVVDIDMERDGVGLVFLFGVYLMGEEKYQKKIIFKRYMMDFDFEICMMDLERYGLVLVVVKCFMDVKIF